MSFYKAGKQAYLSGLPLVVPAGAKAQESCDYRSGYRVAQSNRESHGWSDEYILND